ncbi:opioid growth factor receptor conserved region-domain-containing protein [Mycena belliarum]|uniref:Opioid growth factor receptor conserved region-domain-containing protein n=1 Tax=Mycena belliarum TaxID=1033014 RepID=A0AAD6UAJ0_9AGAR|nr:opioid growth factor receptor conserved region-domain-containing protein [Mycena belliae]
MSASIPRDVQDFLASYPHTPSDPALSANLRFYTNAARCRPDNLLIEEIHDQWHGDYEKLERRHGFIQWLFPIREHGMNYESQPLQAHEIAAMRADPRVLARLLASYALMLDFYGMRLVDAETGAVDRALPPRNYKARYANLVRASLFLSLFPSSLPLPLPLPLSILMLRGPR